MQEFNLARLDKQDVAISKLNGIDSYIKTLPTSFIEAIEVNPNTHTVNSPFTLSSTLTEIFTFNGSGFLEFLYVEGGLSNDFIQKGHIMTIEIDGIVVFNYSSNYSQYGGGGGKVTRGIQMDPLAPQSFPFSYHSAPDSYDVSNRISKVPIRIRVRHSIKVKTRTYTGTIAMRVHGKILL